MSTKRISAILTVLSLFLFTSLVTSDVQAATYSFTTLHVPGAFHTYPASINASGQVTGYYSDGSHTYGFLYGGGTFTTLDVPGAVSTFPESINASGQVAGWYSDGSPPHGFVYSNGTFMTFHGPGAYITRAHSINASSQVAGHYITSSYPRSAASYGFVYSNGTFTILDPPGGTYATYVASINDSGQVTGFYGRSPVRGFVYSNGTFTTFDGPSAIQTLPASINASGQVAGEYSDGSHTHGFVYSNGTFTTLDVPGATNTLATSINASGQVAGVYSDGSHTHGFVYSNSTFTTLDVPGATDTWATSINESGQVTGSYSDGSHNHGFIATPVCATPTVTIHTLTTASQGRFRITGSITHEGAPLCALVLANGQFMFTCGDPLPKGEFDLTVPVDDQGQITLFGFSSGLAPFQQTLEPGALPAAARGRCTTPTVTPTVTAASDGRFKITGSISLDGAPLCALVLANGQFLFTCGDPLPKGDFDLTVPPDDQGKITLFGFAAGLAPFQQTFSPSPSPSTPP
ncbi:MAG: hypothetical protein P9F75_18540 [Candidatus Contendobacter sp.]|nr:hypothetical protein [Candidatus Contendobacter sp.]